MLRYLLNYEKYLVDGSMKITNAIEYSSQNTKILGIDEIKKKLLDSKEFMQDLIMHRGK